MNPILIRKIVTVLIHALVLFLLGLMVLDAVGRHYSYGTHSYAVAFWSGLLTHGSFAGLIYLAYWMFLPQYLITGEYKRFLVRLLLLMFGFAVYYFIVNEFIVATIGAAFSDLNPNLVVAMLPLSGLCIVLGSGLRIFIQWFKDAYDKAQLEKETLQSNLALLKHQLNPHFLFNSLNNIDALIHAGSPNASLALNKLSDMMRYMVYDSERERVTLAEELAYIENYISLQKLRLHNEDLVRFEVNGDAADHSIAPMLFISFIENGFKHSSLKQDAQPIEIRFDLHPDRLRFFCRNAIAHIEKDKASGIGLENVRQRLALIYGKRHDLEVTSDDRHFTVQLTIRYADED